MHSYIYSILPVANANNNATWNCDGMFHYRFETETVMQVVQLETQTVMQFETITECYITVPFIYCILHYIYRTYWNGNATKRNENIYFDYHFVYYI